MENRIQVFKKKEVMNLDEIKKNVGSLAEITDILEDAVTELEVRQATFLLSKFEVHVLSFHLIMQE